MQSIAINEIKLNRCILCASSDLQLFTILSDPKNIASILIKHFWFKTFDAAEQICSKCWQSTEQFHEFYCNIWRLQFEEEIYDVETDLPDLKHESDDQETCYDDNAYAEDYQFPLRDESKMCHTPKPPVRRKFTEFSETDNANIRSFFDMNCKMCDNQFNTFKDAQEHYREAHGRSGFVHCCDKKFRRPCEIKDHIRKHLQPDSFKCGSCDKCFSSQYNLSHHLRFMHSNEFKNTKYKCKICEKSYRLKRYLTAHLYTAHNTRATKDQEKSFGCDNCSKRFSFKATLRKHKHKLGGCRNKNQNKKYMCEICAKMLTSKAGYEMHLLSHSERKAKSIAERLQCDICGAWVNRKSSLIVHMARHNEKPIACTICGIILLNRDSLRKHNLRLHSDKKHSCIVCGKNFIQLQTLNDHLSLHTGQPQHKCLYCSKEFNSNSNMCSHRKKMHPIEWMEERT